MEIAYVLGPRGDEGAVVVEVVSEQPGRFDSVDEVWVQPKRGPGSLRRVTAVLGHTPKGHLVIAIEGIQTREMAEQLRGAALRVRAEDSPPLPEGEYYVHQIIGLEVFTEDGRRLGVMEEIIPTGAHDVYVAGKYLIPAVRHVVISIDIDAGRMVIRPTPGLLDEE